MRERKNQKYCRGCGNKMEKSEKPEKFDPMTGKPKRIMHKLRCINKSCYPGDGCDVVVWYEKCE